MSAGHCLCVVPKQRPCSVLKVSWAPQQLRWRLEGGESEADPDWTDDPPLESPEAEPSSLASSPDVSAQVMTSRRVRRKTAHYSPARSDGSGPADDDPWDWKGIEVDSE